MELLACRKQEDDMSDEIFEVNLNFPRSNEFSVLSRIHSRRE